jgi:hypothetical protein
MAIRSRSSGASGTQSSPAQASTGPSRRISNKAAPSRGAGARIEKTAMGSTHTASTLASTRAPRRAPMPTSPRLPEPLPASRYPDATAVRCPSGVCARRNRFSTLTQVRAPARGDRPVTGGGRRAKTRLSDSQLLVAGRRWTGLFRHQRGVSSRRFSGLPRRNRQQETTSAERNRPRKPIAPPGRPPMYLLCTQQHNNSIVGRAKQGAGK